MKTKSPFTLSPPDIHHASAFVCEVERIRGTSMTCVYVEYPSGSRDSFSLPKNCGLKKGDLVEVLIRKIP